MAATVITGVAYERTGVTLLARIQSGGVNLVQSDLGTIHYEVWKIPTPMSNRQPPSYTAYGSLEQYKGSVELTVASVIYNTLQTDARWTVDPNQGYNFAVSLDQSTFDEIPSADYPSSQWYEIPVRFAPLVGSPFGVNYRIEVQQWLYGKAAS